MVTKKYLGVKEIIVVNESCLKNSRRKFVWRSFKSTMTLSFFLTQNFGCNSSGSHSYKRKKRYVPLYFSSRTKKLCFRRRHLKDDQFHCKHLGLQQVSMTSAAMTSASMYCCHSVPPSISCNSMSEITLLSACCVPYCIPVLTAIMDILCSPKQYAWEDR